MNGDVGPGGVCLLCSSACAIPWTELLPILSDNVVEELPSPYVRNTDDLRFGNAPSVTGVPCLPIRTSFFKHRRPVTWQRRVSAN
jgi:hypothetical protein